MVVMPHSCSTVIHQRKPRPAAAYSPDIQVTVARCRADGGEKAAINLLQDIFTGGVSENALTRKMTREEAREHHGGISTQVYRMLLRDGKAGRYHCRLCRVGANEGGWKNPRDVLRHLKRDHFGLGGTCTSW